MRQPIDWKPQPKLDGLAALQGTQPGMNRTLFDELREQEDRAAAYRAREAGIDQAMKGLDPFWEARVLLRLEPFLARTRYFTPDDIRRIGSPDMTDEPMHPNHWSTFTVRHDKKLWRRLGRDHVSTLKQSHGNPVCRYESLRWESKIGAEG